MVEITYLFLFIYVLLYSYYTDRNVYENKLKFFISLLPISILLIFYLGFQNNVGTDYPTYILIAKGIKSYNFIIYRDEYLFVYLIDFVRIIGIPQLLFFMVGTIQVVFLNLILYELKQIGYKLYNILFLYFTLSIVFFSQFNGIRFYISVYIVIYAILLLRKNKKISFLSLMIFSKYFHYSSIMCFPFIFLRKKLEKKISFNKLCIFLIISIVLSCVGVDRIVEIILINTKYKWYFVGDRIYGAKFINILTKIPKIFIVMCSAYLIEKNKNIKIKNRYLLNLSYMAVCLLIISFSSNLLWRFYQYIDFFIIFPMLELMESGREKQVRNIFIVTLIVMLLFKIVIFPKGEYLYKFIFFNYEN